MSGNRPKTRKTADKNSSKKRRVDKRAKSARVASPRPKRIDRDGWKGLENQKARRPRSVPRSLQDPLIQRMTTLKMAAFTIMALLICTLYIDHVLDTKDLFAEVQSERSENRRLHLQMNRMRANFESRTSPALILERAEQLGLEPSRAFGPTITVSDKTQAE